MRKLLPLLLLLAGCAAEAPPTQEFLAWGDVPYCRRDAGPEDCARRRETVGRLVAAMNRTGVGTAIFVGDTKASNEPCDAAHIIDRPAAAFAAFQGAMIYTPGDNEWTDCQFADRTPGSLGPLAALERLRATFFAGVASQGARPLPLERQAAAGPGVENARWQQGQALFVTLNVPGTIAIQRDGQWRPAFDGDLPVLAALAAQNLAWLEQGFAEARRRNLPVLVLAFQANLWHPCYREGAGPGCAREPLAGNPARLLGPEATRYDYRALLARLAALSANYPGQVLLLHGDTHRWLEEANPSDGQGQGGTIRNATRFMTPGDEDMRAVRIGIAPGSPRPFRFSEIRP
jgi:hypothetical protein